MSHPRRVEVMSEYEASNRLVANRYLGRETLFRDPLPDPDAPLAGHTLPEASADLISQFVNPVFFTLARLMSVEREDRRAALVEAERRAAPPVRKPAPVKTPQPPRRPGIQRA